MHRRQLTDDLVRNRTIVASPRFWARLACKMTTPTRVHLITGGFPPGSFAGHDMEYVRIRLLSLLQQNADMLTTSGNDFADVAKWLPGRRMLITYVAGPHPNDEQNQFIRNWLDAGGRWLALHGTSGGKAVPVGEKRHVRKMVKGSYHETLGCFFLNHPPLLSSFDLLHGGPISLLRSTSRDVWEVTVLVRPVNDYPRFCSFY